MYEIQSFSRILAKWRDKESKADAVHTWPCALRMAATLGESLSDGNDRAWIRIVKDGKQIWDSIIPHRLIMNIGIAAINGDNETLARDFRRGRERVDEYDAMMWAMDIVWMLTHRNGKWQFMRLLTTVSGPQPTIDGRIVNCEMPTAMWSGCSMMPEFEYEQDAKEWAEEIKLKMVKGT